MSFIIFRQPVQKDTQVAKGQTAETLTVSIGQRKLKAYVADSSETRERGLGGRDSLLSDEAMLFLFDTPALHGFWMKDMRFPIDIIWLDESKRVAWVEPNVLPTSFPKIFAPKVPAKYVLETNAGFAAENNIKIGEEVYF